MRHILVVAHQTLEGPHLLEEVGRRIKGGDCRVHVVVPVRHPMGAFSEASVHGRGPAGARRQDMRRIRDLDRTGAVDVTGEVGDANPTYAVEVVHNRGDQIDEVLGVDASPRAAAAGSRRDVPQEDPGPAARRRGRPPRRRRRPGLDLSGAFLDSAASGAGRALTGPAPSSVSLWWREELAPSELTVELGVGGGAAAGDSSGRSALLPPPHELTLHISGPEP